MSAPGTAIAVYMSSTLCSSGYLMASVWLQAMVTMRRDFGPYFLPSTLCRLVSLGPSVLSVDEMFHSAMPFSTGVAAVYRKVITRIQDDVSLPAAAAKVRFAQRLVELPPQVDIVPSGHAHSDSAVTSIPLLALPLQP